MFYTLLQLYFLGHQSSPELIDDRDLGDPYEPVMRCIRGKLRKVHIVLASYILCAHLSYLRLQ